MSDKQRASAANGPGPTSDNSWLERPTTEPQPPEQLRNRRIWLASAAGLLVAGLFVALIYTTSQSHEPAATAQPNASRRALVLWEDVHSNGDQLAITVDFSGNGPDGDDYCSVPYTATATETDSVVSISIWDEQLHKPPVTLDNGLPLDCALMRYPRSITVQLQQPLGDRTIVNGATGQSFEPPSSPLQTTIVPASEGQP